MNRIYICVAFSLLLTSCFKDLGNYDYKDVTDFEVTCKEASYNVYSYVDNLKIEPVVTPGSEEDYEYEWFITGYNKGAHGQTEEYAEVISREKVLDVPFEYPTGEYELHLKVTSKSSGDAEFVRVTVNAVTPYTNACYVLYEMADGNSDMDIHYPDIAPTRKAVNEFAGSSLEGRPESLSYLPRFAYLDETTGTKVFNTLMVPASERSVVTFNTTDMSVARKPEQWFYDDFDANAINHMMYMGFAGFIFTDTGMHTNRQDYQGEQGKPNTGKFSAVPDVLQGTIGYEVSSNVCHLGDHLYFYDKKSGRFVIVDYNAIPQFHNLLIPSPIAGELGTPEMIEGDVIFIGGIIPSDATDTRAMKYLFIVTENEGQRKWYHIKSAYERSSPVSGAVPPYMYIVKSGEFAEDNPFAHASFYTTSKTGANFVYAVHDNEFYMLDINDSYTVKPIAFESQPAGEVTYFQTMFEATAGTSAKTDYNSFVMATCSGGQYTVAFYDMIGGMPIKGQGPSKVYTGEGRVKSIQVASQTKKPGVLGYGNCTVAYSLHY